MQDITQNYFVFLDTEVFIRANFNYSSRSFQKLLELVDEEKIFLYLTTINYQEILANLNQEVKKASAAFKKLHKGFRQEARIIYNSTELKPLLSFSFDEEKFYQELEKEFFNFIEESEAEVISINGVLPEEIFAKYFKNNPPFKEGDKKHEFPDAFAIAALEKKADHEGEKIYVISGDSDWESACKKSNNLVWLESIDKFLEFIISEESKKIDLYYECLDENLSKITQEIANKFVDEIEFSISDAYTYEWGSEDIEVKVELVEIDDRSIVDIEDNFLVFELSVDICFTANISYDSLEMAIWDKEDQRYYNVETIEETVEQNITIPVEVELLYNQQDFSCQIENITLDPQKSIKNIEIKREGEDYY